MVRRSDTVGGYCIHCFWNRYGSVMGMQISNTSCCHYTVIVWLSSGEWLRFNKPSIHPALFRAALYFMCMLDNALTTSIYSYPPEICIKYSYL